MGCVQSTSASGGSIESIASLACALTLKKELHAEMLGNGVCDRWEKWVVWVEKSKDSAPKKELHAELWGKGVCDMWEKWGWLGGEIKDSKKRIKF